LASLGWRTLLSVRGGRAVWGRNAEPVDNVSPMWITHIGEGRDQRF
jgi:hypothetical protein